MKLENQVVSLELSKRLKELGFEQESLFAWTELNGDWFIYYIDRDGGFSIPKSSEEKFISAYTVAELGEMLARGMEGCWKGIDGKWRVGWTHSPKNKGLQDVFESDTEADARAKMLIYLKENKLI
jgi:hypothetical protein